MAKATGMADDSQIPSGDNEMANLQIREGILEVSKTVLGVEEVSSERIRVRPFRTNPAVISVKGGATINLGTYDSARVDVMLSLPCYVEEIDDVYIQVKEWVDRRVALEYKEMDAYKEKMKNAR